jgi:hypothetical protein
MQWFFYDFGLLVVIDLVLLGLVGVVKWLDWNATRGEVPFWFAVTTASFVIIMHLLASFTIAGPLTAADGIPLQVVVSVVFGLLPVTAALMLVCGSWVAGHADSLHGWSRATGRISLENDWGRARTLKRQRDVVGALRQYRRYFNEYPGCPRPLFEAELMLESERCFEEALDLLREILRRFGDDDIHWVEATYRLAHVLEVYYRDFETSHYLLRKVIDRCPDSHHALHARRLLAERSARGMPATVS